MQVYVLGAIESNNAGMQFTLAIDIPYSCCVRNKMGDGADSSHFCALLPYLWILSNLLKHPLGP